MKKVPKASSVPSHPSASPPEPRWPCKSTVWGTWQPEVWELCGGSAHLGSRMARTSPIQLRYLITLKHSTQSKRDLPSSPSSPFLPGNTASLTKNYRFLQV